MAQYNITSTLNGNFKETYGDTLVQLIPASRKCIQLFDFVAAEQMPGNKYHQPVLVTSEQGVSYAAAGAGVVTLENAIAAQMVDAQVDGSQMWIRSAIDNEAAAKASTDGPRAFVKATKLLVENMMVSITKRLEHQLLYGQDGLGVAGANIVGQVITISDASWCPALWAGAENAELDVFSTTAATATLRNSSTLVITAVNLTNKTITVSGTPGAVVTGDVLYWRNARTTTAHKEFAGLNKIITNATTLFNIDAAVYNLWAGTTTSSVGALTFGKVQDTIARCVERGLEEKVILLLAPKAFQVLNADLAGARVFDSSYSSGETKVGTENIKFYGMNGEVEVMPHLFVRDGDAFVVNPKDFKRIGATDVTFNCPGRGGEIFLHLPDKNAFEFRAYSNQSLFCERPAQQAKMTGITYT